MSEDDSFDRFLSSLGFGRWQIPTLLTTVLVLVAAPVHLMGSSFLSAPMPFRCFAGHEEQRNDTPAGLGETGLNTSHFDDVCLPLAFRPQESGPGRLADAGPGLRRTGLASCPFVRYDTAVFASTLVSDFDLICERSWLRPIYVTLYMAGEMVGSLAGGYVGDRWGRRRTVLLASTMNLLLVLVVVSAHNYPLMLCMRLLAGFSVTSMLIPIWSLCKI
ncbi:solute carrier family 22 member 7-like [Penaeus japonicus]|uniref:solute carrier family 22 member 7-like n=1 Tax=Penaeus japonicus TaxID=27405 RepID=UPI001C7103B8|nr:solute carrier family 22 member 7-like [Penaeus japonicus]